MSDLKAHVTRLLDSLRADADLPYEEFVSRWVPPATAPARAREAVSRYLPDEPAEPAFGRMLAAYALCQDACQDRVEGNPECWNLCRRAKAAARRKR